MDVNPSRSSLVVSEESIVEACGETPIPELGLIEQVLETDPIPPKEISDYAATASGRSLSAILQMVGR